jgi:hypothetical protein
VYNILTGNKYLEFLFIRTFTKTCIYTDTSKDKLINNRIKLYGYVSRMKEDRITKKDQDDNNRLGEMLHRRKENTKEQLGM